MVARVGCKFENSTKPGMAMRSSATLTQKCGVIDFFNLKIRQATPMFLIPSYVAFKCSGKAGTRRETNSVGTVEITASKFRRLRRVLLD